MAQETDQAMRSSALKQLSRNPLIPSVPGVCALALLFLGCAHGFVQLTTDEASSAAEAPATENAQTVAESASGLLIADLRAAARQRVALAQPAPVETPPALLAPAPVAAAPIDPTPVAALPPLRGKLDEKAQQTAALDEVEAPLPPRRPANLKVAPTKVAALAPPAAPVEAPVQPPAPQVAAPALQTAPAQLAEAPAVPAQSRRRGRRGRAEVASAPADNRSFLEKLFGGAPSGQQQGQRQALAYASPDAGGVSSMARSLADAPRMSASPGGDTAVYDISAHTVYLPDGTRLEAHSGLGSRLDNPAHVQERMVGPTPPALYALTPREALFHGVAALRLTPISGQVYGRAGLLAHTFMLGPNGDSNGCVSFRDYHAFLRAYQSGQVRKLAVVAHR